MHLEILHMIGSISGNVIFSLKWRYYGPKRIFGILGNAHSLVYCPIISYQRI